MFDRYIKESLKARTRSKRTSGKEVRYKLSDVTDISNIRLKQLLSHIDTKQDLTIYLSNHTAKALEEINKRYVITFDTKSITNLDQFPEELRRHDHEEADTLLLLHCWDIGRQNTFNECIVYSPDTDVFLLLVHFYESLPQSLLFRTGRGKDLRSICIKSCYEAIGPNRAKALLGLHTLTGCDQTEKFSGKSKSFWWKNFLDADSEILDALGELGKIISIYLYTWDLIETARLKDYRKFKHTFFQNWYDTYTCFF